MRSTLAVTRALADQTRLRILMALDGSTLCLSHLTEILALAHSTISKHLKVLTDAGLVSVAQEGKWRYYRLAEPTGHSNNTHPVQWIADRVRDDPLIREDRARRAVALESRAVPFPSSNKPTVLFLCTGNACRSQIAEALLRHHAGDHFRILSAGLAPKGVPALTRAVMQEWGISLEHHRAKHVAEFIGRVPLRYLIVVCRHAESRLPVFPGVTERLFWPIESPAGKRKRPTKSAYRRVRDLMDGRIRDWLDELYARDVITPSSQTRTYASAAHNRSTAEAT